MDCGYFQTPWGLLELRADGSALTGCDFCAGAPAGGAPGPVIRLALRELRDYFEGTLHTGSVPIAPEGTAFQQLVWSVLRQIPYGERVSYQAVAESIGKPMAARAVGAAIGKNPIWIFIPCHRVFGQGGELTGYAGGLDMKRALARLEHIPCPAGVS